MADTAFGQKGEDYVTVRTWYPLSLPFAFFDAEVGKLKAMFYRLLVARVWPAIDTCVGDLEDGHKGGIVLPVASTLILADRSDSSAVSQGPGSRHQLCDHWGALLVVVVEFSGLFHCS